MIVHSDIPAEFREIAIAKAKEALASAKVREARFSGFFVREDPDS